MGAFYTNVTLVTASPKAVASLLDRWGRRAFIASALHSVVVFDARSEAQDGANANLALRLSAELRCVTLAATVHDDDLLLYLAADDGRMIDEYTSDPLYFAWTDASPMRSAGGRPAELVRLFGAGDAPTIESILRNHYDLATERHSDLVDQLKLPRFAAGLGYDALTAGVRPPELEADALMEV
jgi:hypothetical protein